MIIKNKFADSMGAFRVTKVRNQAISEASDSPLLEDEVTLKARKLHQGYLPTTVCGVEEMCAGVKRFTFQFSFIPYFTPGQYLSLRLKIGDSIVSRPYSICSSRSLAKEQHQLQIIVKKADGGFVSSYLVDRLNIGDHVEIEYGLGEFTIDRFRDKPRILAIAGGVGITPFLSMAKSLQESNPHGIEMTILYGCQKESEIIAKKELDALNHDRVRVIYVLADEPSWTGEHGFINTEIIQKYAPKESYSVFFCGPAAMKYFVINELSKLKYDIRKIRMESFGGIDISKDSRYPKELLDKNYKLTIHRGMETLTADAFAQEPIAVALERAGIKIHTRCRGGVCGICRIKVISGNVYVPKENDGRRDTDKKLGYVHCCHAYPMSDLEIKIPIE